MIQYNKLYRSLKEVLGEWHAGHLQWQFCWKYFKFYEDGTLIYCSSPQKPNEMSWFNRETTEYYFGKYTITGSKIEGYIDGTQGKMSFSGITPQTEIVLQFTVPPKSHQVWNYFEVVEE